MREVWRELNNLTRGVIGRGCIIKLDLSALGLRFN